MDVQSSSLFTGLFFMWKALTLQRGNSNEIKSEYKSSSWHYFSIPPIVGLNCNWWEKDLSTSALDTELKLQVITVNTVTLREPWICISFSTSNPNESPGLLELMVFLVIQVINIFLLLEKGKACIYIFKAETYKG